MKETFYQKKIKKIGTSTFHIKELRFKKSITEWWKGIRKTYILMWLFQMCKTRNYPTIKDNKLQTVESTTLTYHTTDGREIQSIHSLQQQSH